MTESKEKMPSVTALTAVMRDKIDDAKDRGEYDQFKSKAMEDINRKTGLGRWLQDGIDQASTPEDADRIFVTAYIFVNVRSILNNPPKPEEQ